MMEQLGNDAGVRANNEDDGLSPRDYFGLWKVTEESLQKICRNDSDVVGLRASPSYFAGATTADWRRAGDAVGSNTKLRDVRIDVFGGRRSAQDALEAFCLGLAKNTSIEVLMVEHSTLSERHISSLAPFFERNNNLRCIELRQCQLPRSICSLTAALSKCNERSLKKIVIEPPFSFDSNCYDDTEGARFIASLGRHLHLEVLKLSHFGIGIEGCIALAKLLTRSGTRLKELNIEGNCDNLDDGCIVTLADALAKNNTLTELGLAKASESITSVGWCALSAVLRSPGCPLQMLCIDNNSICDRAAGSLGCALGVNKSLKALAFGECHFITAVGWRAFCSFLQSPTSELEELYLDNCDIDDEGVIAVGQALVTNRKLTTLHMGSSYHGDISEAGWTAFFGCLLRNRTLKTFYIHSYPSIGLAEWQLFSNLLRRPNAVLEELDISCDEDTDDEVAICLANALAHNTSLTMLDFGHDCYFTDRSWAAFFRTLCNTSSIDNTFSSNHTLERIDSTDHSWIDVPADLKTALNMNKGSNKVEVARQKILKHHLSEPESDVQVFTGLDWNVLPRATEWIGRDHLGFSLHYQLFRSIPSLYELNAKPAIAGAKRKIDEANCG